MKTPRTGYWVEIDLAGNLEDVVKLRHELNPQGVHVKLLEEDGPAGGNPLVRLASLNVTRLDEWLDKEGYDREANEIIVASTGKPWTPMKKFRL